MPDEFTKARIELFRERIIMLQERIRLLETQNAILRDDIARLTTPAPTRSANPLYLSESQEDIIHARETQALSIAEAEDMLRELDFENSEIILDEPDGDLLSLY